MGKGGREEESGHRRVLGSACMGESVGVVKGGRVWGKGRGRAWGRVRGNLIAGQ